MDFQECIDFANQVHTCYLATVEGDQPRVRVMGLYSADETGFTFESKSVKALCKQLENNNKVEAVFFDKGKVMRVYGEVEFIDDIDFRTTVFNNRPRMKEQGIKGPDDPLLAIFRIYKGEAYFWTMADNMKEAEIERIKFGR